MADRAISRRVCVDHCILLLQHLSNHMLLITNGYTHFSKTNSTDPRQRVPLIPWKPYICAAALISISKISHWGLLQLELINNYPNQHQEDQDKPGHVECHQGTIIIRPNKNKYKFIVPSLILCPFAIIFFLTFCFQTDKLSVFFKINFTYLETVLHSTKTEELNLWAVWIKMLRKK